MTLRFERRVIIDAPVEDVWGVVADHGERARALTMVRDVEDRGDVQVEAHVASRYFGSPRSALPAALSMTLRGSPWYVGPWPGYRSSAEPGSR